MNKIINLYKYDSIITQGSQGSRRSSTIEYKTLVLQEKELIIVMFVRLNHLKLCFIIYILCTCLYCAKTIIANEFMNVLSMATLMKIMSFVIPPSKNVQNCMAPTQILMKVNMVRLLWNYFI